MTAGLELAPAVAFTRAGAIDDDILDVAARARRFAREVLRPAGLRVDRRMERDHDYFPWPEVVEGARRGWLAAAIPRGWGGGGLGITAMSVAIEEMCAGDAGLANIFGAHGLGLLPVMLCGDLALAADVLGSVARAERTERPKLCAFAITEPGAGSDVEERDGLERGDVRAVARPVAGGYRVSGRKVFISNGSVADHVAVYAAVDPRDRAGSWTAVLVDRGSDGFACARVERKLGQRACPAAELVFDDVFVPAHRRIGREGDGWELTRRVLAVSRGPVGAIATGIARDAYEAALDWVRALPAERREPWMHDRLAVMAMRIRAARAAYVEAAAHCDAVLMPGRGARAVATAVGRFAAARRALEAAHADRSARAAEAWAHQVVLGATAKVVASDAAMWVTTEVLDVIPPGAGELRARAEKAFRDAKLTQIYEGTNQINARALADATWLRPAQLSRAARADRRG